MSTSFPQEKQSAVSVKNMFTVQRLLGRLLVQETNRQISARLNQGTLI